MEPRTIPMTPPEPNAFAAWYALTPAGRVVAAVRLIRLLKRERKRMLRRLFQEFRLDHRWGCYDGPTDSVQGHLLTLTTWIDWLEGRYGLRRPAVGPVVTRLANEDREFTALNRRDTTTTRVEKCRRRGPWPT